MEIESMNTKAIAGLSLVGGILCLDFTNTVSWRGGETLRDHLQSYGDLLYWATRVNLLRTKEAGELGELAESRPEEAKQVLKTAVDLRETLFRIFSALAAGIVPSEEDMRLFNQFLSRILSKAAVVRENERYVLGFERSAALDRLLAPIAWSAAELLTGSAVGRVKECAGDACSWLFVDTSKNHSRRWCEMSDCGNRAKARRHYTMVKSRERTIKTPRAR
jgi:predicted RNA-binding Zn ribbon-like protein